MIDPIVVKMNPKITAFGAYGNNTGQSKAGFEFGTSFIEIPWKAGTNSANSKRTPGEYPKVCVNLQTDVR